MAIAATYQTVVTAAATTSTNLGTFPSSTTSYARDLIVTNSGASTCFISAGTGVSSASTTVSFAVPSGGSILLANCQLPASTILFGFAAASPAGGLNVSIGYGSVVSVI